MRKRIISSVLIFILIMACFIVPSSAASTVFLNGANYPTSYKAGETFSVYGTISSDYTLTYVWVGVCKADGSTAFYYEGKPEAKNFYIHSIDAKMTFSKLAGGTYTYKIIASNSKESKTVLLAKSFTVIADESTFTLTNETYPTSLEKGNTFSIYGMLSCSDTMTSVTAGVYKTDGTAAFSKTVYPYSRSYNLHNIDSYMTFSKLDKGSYTYKIIASTAKTSKKVVIEKAFTVDGVVTAESMLKSVNWKVYDISSWTTIYNWDKFVKGVDAVVLRIGYTGTRNGACYEDSSFKANYDKLTSYGIPVGCYYYSTALSTSQAQTEAQFVINLLKKYNCKLSMPVYFDAETESQMSLYDSTMTNIVRAFCDKMTANGFYSGFYCSKSFLTDEVIESKLTDITKWVAQYTDKCYYTGSYGMWQYTANGTVGGTSDPIDFNKCYCDYPTYIIANGLNGYPKKVETPSFSIKTDSNLTVSDKIITLKTVGMTTQKFTDTYVTKTSNVTLSFENTASGKITTGTTVIAKSGTSTLGTYTVAVKGDVVPDGVINSDDVSFILENSINLTSFTEIQKISADYNSDGKINSADASGMLKKIAG